MIRPLAIMVLLLAVGCGSKPEPSSPDRGGPASPPANEMAPAPPVDAAAAETTADAGVATCEDACTEIAVCYEEVNDTDYAGGGQCVSRCEEMDEPSRQSFFACVASSDCGTMLEC